MGPIVITSNGDFLHITLCDWSIDFHVDGDRRRVAIVWCGVLLSNRRIARA
jgi:hypothetical protein